MNTDNTFTFYNYYFEIPKRCRAPDNDNLVYRVLYTVDGKRAVYFRSNEAMLTFKQLYDV